MLIVDSQVHIWAANTPQRPWVNLNPPYPPHRPQPFTKDDLLREMDGAGVQRAVLVPPPLEGWRNDLALEATCTHPDRLGVMGLFDVDAPDARSRVASWCRQPGMLGLRIMSSQIAADWLWAEAERAGVPVMRSVSQPHLQPLSLIAHIAERHPGLRLTIDHMGMVTGKKDAAAFAHLDDLLALARYPNIAVKASALPLYTTDSYPYRNLHGYIRRAYDAYGPRRLFWGTDYTRMPCTYRQVVTLFTEELPWLTADDKEWIMGRGLCEWIGWKL